MASTFNAFELLQGNGSATSSKKKKSKKKMQAEATVPVPTSAADPSPSDVKQTAPTNGSKHRQDTFNAEIAALSTPLAKHRSDAWASWAAKMHAEADALVDTATSLGHAMATASAELRSLAVDAMTSVAQTVRTTAAARIQADIDVNGRLEASKAEIALLEQSVERSTNNAWDHIHSSSKLIQALEKQMALLQPTGTACSEAVTPAEWCLNVLQTRAAGPTNGTPSLLLHQLQRDEAALQQQATSLAAEIAAAEAALTTLRGRAADVATALSRTRHRHAALFQPVQGDAAALEQAAVQQLQSMLALLKGDAAAPAQGVDDAQRDNAMRFLDAMERHVQCLDRLQAEAIKSLEFNLERLSVAAEQEQRLRLLNMAADADKPAKMRAERTAKVHESLRMLQDAHARTNDGVQALRGMVATVLGPAEAVRLAKLTDAVCVLQDAYERVVGACRQQGVTV